MTDYKLLELAAKAAGLKIKYNSRVQEFYHYDVDHNSCGEPWNPLTDDGDALRLAVKLKMRLSTVCNDGNASLASATDMYIDVHLVDHGDDPYAATRRTIVQAAAEIGRRMK